MNKKALFSIIVGLCLITSFCSCQPDPDIPDVAYDETSLYGKWQQEGTNIFYRYDSNKTGATWDEDDDVYEDEAQKFTWELDGSEMIHIHLTETGTAQVPKYYIITKLTSERLCYHDAYVSSKTYSFNKIN